MYLEPIYKIPYDIQQMMKSSYFPILAFSIPFEQKSFVNTKSFRLTAGQDNEWKYAKLVSQIIKAEHIVALP